VNTPSSTSILAIETSTNTGSLALSKNGEIVFEHSFISDRSHNCDLFGPLGKALEHLNFSKLSQVLVGTGPGSYGGTRVGIAAAHGISTVHSCDIAGVQSFEAIPQAQDIPESWIIGDARRSQFYAAQLSGGQLNEENHQLLKAEPFEKLISPLIGKGLSIFSLDPKERFSKMSFGESEILQVVPDAKLLIKRWLNWNDEEQSLRNKTPVEPTYLAPPHITISTKKVRGIQAQ